MKKVLLISDSHGNMDGVRKIIKDIGKVDMAIHMGDIIGQDELLREIVGCPVHIVRGNCDYSSSNPYSEVIIVGRNRIYATHGHIEGVNWSFDGIVAAAKEAECNVALYGHTHVPDISTFAGLLIINPGSVTNPRQLNRKPTYGILEIGDKGEINAHIEYV